jgi:NAD(P)-dependent dehydrogenase (short-subunit alcohol dehydrogenase family)
MVGRTALTYFVTGSTGFLGRFLLQRLLAREPAAQIGLLVRAASRERLEGMVRELGGERQVTLYEGDLTQPQLGLGDDAIASLRGSVEHFFHLAAVYDMTADDERNRAANVEGTRHAVELANALGAGCLHHVSSIAVAGEYDGYFREDMFDEGQPLPSSYHRTKFESERLVRSRAEVPWRVYRPAIVVGHSKTGEMDKIDGPYYFFKPIQKVRHLLPEWVPLVGPEMGDTNVVPVDYVIAAMDHIAHQPGLDGQAFHLTNPRRMSSGDVINIFAKAGHAPQLALRIDKPLLDLLPKGLLSAAMKLPALRQIRRQVLSDLGVPEEVLEHIALVPRFDTRDTERALEGSGIAVPELADYAPALWDYWERHLDPDLHRDRTLSGAVRGRTVVITGGSSGIGKAAALQLAAAGAIPILVARSADKLEEARAEIIDAGGEAYTYSVDLASVDAIEEFVGQLLNDHPRIDMLVNNAGRSIRRGVLQSLDRFHDYERTMTLNYFGTIKLITSLLPHWKETGGGHIVNVSSIGVQTNPPRFAAYVASKSALDGWTSCVASEVVNLGITFTTIHMPLVRTPMIAPTKIYDAFPTITPEEAGGMICDALRAKPKEINTRLGTFGSVMKAIAPKAVDQVLHMAYRVFPESTAAKGKSSATGAGGDADSASNEALMIAHLLKGVHW